MNANSALPWEDPSILGRKPSAQPPQPLGATMYWRPSTSYDDGLLWFRGRWVSLSPVERSLADGLVERFGAVTGRESLRKRAWPEGLPSRNALDVHMVRLRRRIAELALEVRTVRSRGYLMQAVEPAN